MTPVSQSELPCVTNDEVRKLIWLFVCIRTATDPTMATSSSATSSNYVYIRDEDDAWLPARLLEIDSDGRATVSVPCFPPNHDMLSVDVPKKRLVTIADSSNDLFLQNCDAQGKVQAVPDLVDLDFLHEPAILYNLKWRHLHRFPYTRTGELMIAVNPYQWIHSLYNEDQRQAYAEQYLWNTMSTEKSSRIEQLPPHVYETSCFACRGLALGENQSILVSGESGAGKTETVKIVLSDIASNTTDHSIGGGATDDTIHVQRILDSNPLLEAFGNAQTVRNDNSSRFGKYIQLQFRVQDAMEAAYQNRLLPHVTLVGSTCEVYLLEQSRVVRHDTDIERTYHIFYQLLASPMKTQFWHGLEDTTNESFRYVGPTDTHEIENVADEERFRQTIESLALVDVVDEKLQTLMQAICIVLVLGNLVFEPTEGDEESSTITSVDDLRSLAELMGVPLDHLTSALTIRTVTARNESFSVPLTAIVAKDSCDAFAKEIYATTFHWLVRQINLATTAAAPQSRSSPYGTIGLLDIFGFERFETNRFEQLCINYANEKLQQKFTQDIFRSVQAEYEAEGIALGEITYEDNADVLELVEGRMGLIAVLNEECVRPGGSDKGFVSKSSTMNKHNTSCFIKENGMEDCAFGIQHYAGVVVYDATGCVTKNMDTLPFDLQDCAKKSTNAILAKEICRAATSVAPSSNSRTAGSSSSRKGQNVKRGGLVGDTVWSKFRNQLTVLMTNLSETRTRYIRCIKPNQMKQPLIMDHTSTVEQLRCAGVVAAVTISRSAFPNRMDHEVVLDRFRSLWRNVDREMETKALVDTLLEAALKSLASKKDDGEVVKAYVMGNTRTYFRAGSLEHLEKKRVRALMARAVDIQRTVRRYLAQTRYGLLRQRVITIQSFARMLLCRMEYLRQQRAATLVQCLVRCVRALRLLIRLRRNASARKIQSQWRRHVCLRSFHQQRTATIAIQRIMRGAVQRPKFRTALHEKREEAKLENQVMALQRKLEEAERRRVEAEHKAEVAVSIVEPREEKKEVESEVSSVPPPPQPTQPEPALPIATQQHQQTLMDESGKMLEYLRKEVFKLRSHNSRMRRDFDLLKENNQRLMDANASAGASFAALNQHAKQLAKSNERYKGEVHSCKGQIQQLSLTQVELKEELKMKQATYIAEVHSRLQYQKALSRIMDITQQRCGDDRLVEDILRVADACQAEYLDPGTASPGSIFSTPTAAASGRGSTDSGLMKSIRKLWS